METDNGGGISLEQLHLYQYFMQISWCLMVFLFAWVALSDYAISW